MFNKIISFFIIFIIFNSNCVLSIHYSSGDGIKAKVPTRENLNRNFNAYQQNHYHDGSEGVGMHHQYSQVRSYRSGSESGYQSQTSTGPQITTSMLPPPRRTVEERQLSYQEYMQQQQQQLQQQQQSGRGVSREFGEQHTTNQNNYDQESQYSNQNAQIATHHTREQRQYVAQASEKQVAHVTECPPDATGQFPYLMDCRQFLNCWKGRGSIQSCPPGTLFNPEARECDFPNKVTCESMNNAHSLRTGSRGAQALIARGPVECESGTSGLFPHPYECAKFLNCANGITYIQDCGPGTVFNPLFSVCDYPYNVDCGGKAISTVETNHLDEDTNIYENYRRSSSNQNEQQVRPVYNQNQDYNQQQQGSSNQNTRTGYGRHDDHTHGTRRYEGADVYTQQSTANQNRRTNQFDDQISSLNQNGGNSGRGSHRYDAQSNRAGQSGNQFVGQSNEDRQISYQFGSNDYQSQNRGSEQARPTEATTPVPRKWVYPWEARTTTTTPRTIYRIAEQTTTETPKPIYYRQQNLDRQHTHLTTQQTTQQQHTSVEQQLLSGSKSKYNDENPPWVRRQQKQQTEYREDPLDIQQQHTSWDLHQQSSNVAEKIISTTTPQPEQSHIQSINRKTSRYNHHHHQHQTNQVSDTHGNLGTINSNISLHEAMQLLLRPYLNRSGSVTENDLNQFHQSLLPLTDVEKINDNRTIYENGHDIEWNRKGNGNDIGDDNDISGENLTTPIANDDDVSGETLTTPQPNVSDDSRYNATSKSNTGDTRHIKTSVSFSNTNIHEKHRKNAHGHRRHHFRHHHHHGHHGSNERSGEHVDDCENNSLGHSGSGEPEAGEHRHRPHSHHHRHNHHHHNHHSQIHHNRCNRTTIGNEMSLPLYPLGQHHHFNHSYGIYIANHTTFCPHRHHHGHHHHHHRQHFIPSPAFVPRQDLLPPIPYPSFVPQPTPPTQQFIPRPSHSPDHHYHRHHHHHHRRPHFIPSSPPLPPPPTQNLVPPLPNPNFIPQLPPPPTQHLVPPLPPSPPIHTKFPYVPNPNLPLPPRLPDITYLPPNPPSTDLLPPPIFPIHTSTEIPSPLMTTVTPQISTIPINDSSLPTITNSSIPSTGVLPLPVIPTTPVDNSFQYHTNFNNCADSSSFACGNGECVNEDDVCDGKSDCSNRKDELNCNHIGYEVRLSSDSGNTHEGRVEVKVYGVWGYICDDKFGMRDADVLCRELGFELGASEVRANSFYSPHVNVSTNGNPIFMMDEIDCLGNETSLSQCNFNGWGVHDCNPEEVVGVVCKIPVMACPLNYWLCDTSKECIPTSFLCDNVADCADGSDERVSHCQSGTEIRLVGGVENLEGRLEIKYRGIWGTVCDDDFTNREATVVCRALGHGGPAFSVKGGFGPGTGQIWLDQVNCIGNETSIEDCTHWAWGEHNCAHSEDVGIRCTSGPVLPYVPVTLPASQNNPNFHKSGRNLTNDFPEIVYQMQRSSRILPDQCGRVKVPGGNIFDQPNYSFRVIKGTQSSRGQHPWQATIRVRGQGKSAHWCGAVVISRYHLLTAAHCLIGFPKGAYLTRMGDHNSEVYESSEVEIFIENIYSHEDFRKGQHMNNDIALVVLKQPVRFNNYIQPVCMPPSAVAYEPGMNCTISGWGSIQSGKSTPSIDLRAGTVPILPMELCKQKHVYGTTITEGMFCAGFLDEGVDACDGDSGGPLVCMHNGVHTLYGIISWGQHCGYENRPGVYTKVAHYNDWIQEKLNQSMHAYGV